jgi:hypothetical protein
MDGIAGESILRMKRWSAGFFSNGHHIEHELMQYLKLQHIAIDREVMELVSTDAL